MSLLPQVVNQQWKCLPHHKNSYRHLLHLDPNSKAHLICPECMHQKNIPDSKVLSIIELLESDENSFFSTYPILRDQHILVDLQNLEQQKNEMMFQIKEFFVTLTRDIKNQIQQKLLSQSQTIESLFEIQRESNQLYKGIAQVNKLKKVILSQEPNSEDELHKIIVDHISHSKSNSVKIQQVIQKFRSKFQKFNTEANDLIHSRIVNLIEELEFFPETYAKSMKEEFESTEIKKTVSTKKEIEQFLLGLQPSKCQNIQILELTILDKKFDHISAESLSSTLSQLNNINSLQLKLRESNIGVKGVESLSSALSQLRTMNSLQLNLGSNNIGQKGAQSLSSALSQLKNINSLHLDLDSNNIGDKGTDSLSYALSQLKNMKSLQLNLGSNNIEEKGADSLSFELSHLKNMKSLQLNLGSNNIGEKGAESLSSALSQLKNMNDLQLKLMGNNIGDKGTDSLSFALSQLKNMNSLLLHFESNNIGEKGAESLSSALSQLKNINSLQIDLENNNIGDKGAESFFQALIQLSNMNFLQLSLHLNNISEKEADSISSVLNELENLQRKMIRI